jgi:hypothetical protein
MSAANATWQVHVTNVRRFNGGLRWTLAAATEDLETVVTADSTASGGRLLYMQSDEYCGWTGDQALDDLVIEVVEKAVAGRAIHRQIDAIERPRERSDRLRWSR